MTVTVYDPLKVAVQDNVEVPEPPVIVVGVSPQVMPLVGEVAIVKVTVPAKPLDGLTVMIALNGEPTFPLRLVGAALMLKSSIVNVAVVEWESVPLVPVIVSVYVPAIVELQDTEAAPDAVMLDGKIGPQLRLAGRVSVRLTVPTKPFRKFTVIVEVAGTLASTAAGEVAAMLKSVTVTVVLAEWDSVPLAPAMPRV